MSYFVTSISWIARELLAPIVKTIVVVVAPVIAGLIADWLRVRFAPAVTV